ncbi:MAG: lipid-A-disaccharide synthase [Proteobacteria bacterium]|nr:lipid-A-disaccharide synthase [Pseudomonadota bacterium]
MKPTTIMLVAAEASGDSLGAGLAKALRRRLGPENVRFVGVGGSKMAAEGIESPFDISELSIFGWIDGLKAYPRVMRRVRETAALARREKPDIAVLIDSWGFTLRVAKAIRAEAPEVPLVKYVGPQVWASRPGRAKTLAGAVDHLLALNTFDVPWFERAGLATTFVGNPSLATDLSGASGERFRASIGAGAADPVLLVLPGSRPKEIERLMPPFEDAVKRLKETRPELHVAVVVADTVADRVKGMVSGWPFRAHLIDGEGPKRDAMVGSTVALACSGTVSSEIALAGCPMIIAYRLDKLTYSLAKHVVTCRYITLMNIAEDRAVVPEFIQDDCNGPALATALAERLDNPALREAQVADQFKALETMGRDAGEPSENAAEAVLKVLEQARAGAAA